MRRKLGLYIGMDLKKDLNTYNVAEASTYMLVVAYVLSRVTCVTCCSLRAVKWVFVWTQVHVFVLIFPCNIAVYLKVSKLLFHIFENISILKNFHPNSCLYVCMAPYFHTMSLLSADTHHFQLIFLTHWKSCCTFNSRLTAVLNGI